MNEAMEQMTEDQACPAIRYNKGPVDKVIYKPRFHAIIPARRDRR